MQSDLHRVINIHDGVPQLDQVSYTGSYMDCVIYIADHIDVDNLPRKQDIGIVNTRTGQLASFVFYKHNTKVEQLGE